MLYKKNHHIFALILKGVFAFEQSEIIPIEPEQVMLLRKIDSTGLRYISFNFSSLFILIIFLRGIAEL